MNDITLNDLLIKLEEYNKEKVEIVKKDYIYADDLSYGSKEDWIDKVQTSLTKRKIK